MILFYYYLLYYFNTISIILYILHIYFTDLIFFFAKIMNLNEQRSFNRYYDDNLKKNINLIYFFVPITLSSHFILNR